jgi:ATP-dependent DNA ligase
LNWSTPVGASWDFAAIPTCVAERQVRTEADVSEFADAAGLLNHVGFTSGLGKEDRVALRGGMLEPLIEPPGFTGKAPGGPSRWNDGKESPWEPLRAELVVEMRYDQTTGDRFRHGTGLMRWRPDKAPRQCRMEQLHYELRPSQLADIG